MASTEQVILHYQKDIENICTRPERALKYKDRLLHCLSKLNKLPITVKHLQVTGVGKTVNSLRKINGKNGVSDAAKALVAKWKNVVIEEDDDEEEEQKEVETSRVEDAKRLKAIIKKERAEYSPDQVDNSQVSYQPSQGNSEFNSYSPQSLSQNSDSEVKKYSPSKKSHTPNGYSPGSPKSNGIQVFCYSPSKKNEKNDDKQKRGKSESKKGRASEKSRTVKHSSDSSGEVAHSDSERHSSRSKSEKPSSSEKASHRSHKSEHRSSAGPSSSASHTHSSSSKDKSAASGSGLSNGSKSKSQHSKKLPVDDGIDFLSGASFAQALGPMVVKKGSSNPSPRKKIKLEPEEPQPSTSQPSKHVPSSSESRPRSSKDRISRTKRSPSPERKLKLTSMPSVKQLLDDVAGPSHLAPLDMEVVTTLSVPTPNYRPMPLPPLTSGERRQRAQAEEDALERIMSNRNKNSRTKVYSGVKGGLSYVPSLYEICCNVLKLHIDALEFTGGIPYSLLKPVLDGASPSQLYQFEHFNPYVIGETEHLWQFHVNREFRGETREEMETYRDMYLRCLDEREEKYKAVTANITESIKKSVPVRQTKLAYVDVAKPPRAILRKQMKNGTSRPDAERLIGKDTPGAVRVRAPERFIERQRVSPHYKPKPKVAPLMQKTLKSIKQTRFKR